ncbi:MAG: hypothetical protein AAFO69_07970, partial [Bacteroidota bacterium]
NDIKSVFKQYYKCNNISYTDYTVTKKYLHLHENFHFSLVGGINFLQINALPDPRPALFSLGRKSSGRYGMELEYSFSKHNDFLSLVINPSYVQYNVTKTKEQVIVFDITRPFTIEMEYRSIELPIGLRSYIGVSDDLSLFFNIFYNLNLAVESTWRFRDIEEQFDTRPQFLSLGLGVTFRKRLKTEIRYQFEKEYSEDGLAGKMLNSGLMLNFGWRLF